MKRDPMNRPKPDKETETMRHKIDVPFGGPVAKSMKMIKNLALCVLLPLASADLHAKGQDHEIAKLPVAVVALEVMLAIGNGVRRKFTLNQLKRMQKEDPAKVLRIFQETYHDILLREPLNTIARQLGIDPKMYSDDTESVHH